jgi:hypothetical protein
MSIEQNVLRPLMKPRRLDSRLWLRLSKLRLLKPKPFKMPWLNAEEDLRVHEEEATEAQNELQRLEKELKEAREKSVQVQA